MQSLQPLAIYTLSPLVFMCLEEESENPPSLVPRPLATSPPQRPVLPLPNLRQVPHPTHSGKVCKSWVSNKRRQKGRELAQEWLVLDKALGKTSTRSLHTGDPLGFFSPPALQKWSDFISVSSKTFTEVCAPQAADLMSH